MHSLYNDKQNAEQNQHDRYRNVIIKQCLKKVIEPVTYTHLDVYKRQVKYNGQYQCVKHLRQNHTPEVAEKMNSPSHQKHKAILHNPVYQIGNGDQKQWGLDAVSYTHLKNIFRIDGTLMIHIK